MSGLNDFFAGTLVLGLAAAALLFFRFYARSRDRSRRSRAPSPAYRWPPLGRASGQHGTRTVPPSPHASRPASG